MTLPHRSRRHERPLRAILYGCVAVWLVAPGACTRRAPDGAEGGVASATADAESLGTVDFRISCSPKAQETFNRGVALLHHMTYPQARTTFEETASIDPQCAMAQWGIAMTLFQPLWPTRPSPQALRTGWDAVQRALALDAPTERERLYVAAAEAFFLSPDSSDYWLRIRRWQDATRRVHEAFPDDVEGDAFFALALLATAPDPSQVRAHADSASDLLLQVYRRNPNHPGAMHYLVHANDITGREHQSLDIVHQYDASAPGNPHALHMPTHIYTRLGDWEAVIQGNLRAATAALRYPAGEQGQYVWDEFPHAIEYLVYAYLQQGADESAAAQIARLRGTAGLEPTFKTAFHLASTQARYALERRDWDAASRLVPREGDGLDWDRFMWPEAITVFARGMGLTHSGKPADAATLSTRLETLERATAAGGEALFSSNIRVLRLSLDAWRAERSQNPARAVALMQEAVDLEGATPKHAVTPAPTLPALEQLGDLQLEQEQPAVALQSYRAALALYPQRFNGLLGAARAARAGGDTVVARRYYEQVVAVARGVSRRDALDEAHGFIAAASTAK